MTELQTKSFLAAMLDYFGKNGRSNSEFMDEIKQLSEADRAWFKKNLATVGYRIV